MIFEFVQLALLQLIIFGVAGYGYRANFLTQMYARKFVHILTGVVAVITPLFLEKEAVGLYALVAIPALFVAHRYKLTSFIGSEEKVDYGLLLFPLGVLISVVFFWNVSYVPFQFAMLMLAVPDALAGLVGRALKYKTFTFLKEKSVSGSITFFLSSLIGAYLMLSVEWPVLVIIALILTITEAISGDLMGDNLTVPIVAGLLALQLM